MLAIIKIDESFAVVDLDEDTELFESLDEAEDTMLEYMSQAKLDRYRAKQSHHFKHYVQHADKADVLPSGLKRDAHRKAAQQHVDKAAHHGARLSQRAAAIRKLERRNKLKKMPARD